MNILLWILQVLMAVHTLIGAFWKFGNPVDQAVPTLAAIPPGVWLLLSVVEIICAVLLLLPALKKNMMKFVPLAAGVIALEMVVFCAIHASSGATDNSPMVYWLVVAAICAFLAFGRAKITKSASAQRRISDQ